MKKNSLIIFLSFFILFLCKVTVFAGILKSGDVIQVFVANHPELTKSVVISQDGTVDYPFLGSRPVSGMTAEELGDYLTFQLAKKVPNPFVMVSTTDDIPIKVRVLGQITKPGIVQLVKGSTLQEVILAAGGPTDYANLAEIKIIREKSNEADAVYVNYREFLEKGNISVLPEVRNNDTVLLLSSPRNLKIKVLGSVVKPGYYAIQGETNIFDAIYLAGGPAEKADFSKVRHILKTDDKSIDEVIDLQEYLDKGQLDNIPLIKEGDIIIVYKKFITWTVVLDFIKDALLVFTAYQVFTRGV